MGTHDDEIHHEYTKYTSIFQLLYVPNYQLVIKYKIVWRKNDVENLFFDWELT